MKCRKKRLKKNERRKYWKKCKNKSVKESESEWRPFTYLSED
jgi:hypothetical protein